MVFDCLQYHIHRFHQASEYRLNLRIIYQVHQEKLSAVYDTVKKTFNPSSLEFLALQAVRKSRIPLPRDFPKFLVT